MSIKSYEVRFNGSTVAKRDTFKEATKAYEYHVERSVVSGGLVELVQISEVTLLSTAEKLDATIHAASRKG